MDMSVSVPALKTRKVHMNDKDCLDHSKTETGALPLTNPALVKKSSKDPNRGLYPRFPNMNPALSGSFVSAKDVMGAGPEKLLQQVFGHSAHFQRRRGSKRKETNAKTLPTQKNNLNKYFKPEGLSSTAPCISAAVKEEDIVCLTPPSGFLSTSRGNSTPANRSPSKPLKKIPGTSIYVDMSLSTGKSSGEKRAVRDQIDVSKVLFDSQKSGMANLPAPKSMSKKRKKVPTFNRDNAFLYSTVSTPQSSSISDPVRTDMYGLLGDADLLAFNSDDDLEPANHFLSLPKEVIENIFCHLPLMELLLNVSLVCHTWNDIISHGRFAPWKKKYYKLKSGDQVTKAEMAAIMQANGMDDVAHYLPGLIKYMVDFKRVTAGNMLEYLQKHPMYSCAVDLIIERFPECIKNETPNPWSVICMLSVLSQSVRDIEHIIWHLVGSTSHCSAMEVSECLYCIATFLHAFKTLKYHDIWTGMHYRVLYGLYLFENSSSQSAAQLKNAFKGAGQQTIVKYSSSDNLNLTHEQFRICNHDIQDQQTIKIVAFAGTGKTTTLLKYTQLRPSQQFLLVVYNKSVCEHAKSRFPPNVTCKTGHSLAYGKTGIKYRGNLRNLKVTEVINALPSRKGQSLFVRAKWVIDSLNNFMASADPHITSAHVPTRRMDEDGNWKEIDHATQLKLADDAQLIWQRMTDVRDRKIPMPHDGYLKLYQLMSPTINDYDVILIDEAQDLTPAIADILLRQKQPKILVGDPHQQIYAFRGAVNAMQNVQATHTYYLTQSFRFGPEIAFVAASCLEFLKGECKKVLVGNGIPGSICGDIKGQVAVICRSNFTVFQEAVKKCCYSDENIKVAFVGGTAAFGFDMILDIYALMIPKEQRDKEGRKIKNGLVEGFSNHGVLGFCELEKYAKKTSDQELLGKIKIVKVFNIQLPSLIEKIIAKTIEHIDIADVVFSTAHKAKGLEFSTVRLADDYLVAPSISATGAANASTSSAEANLLYVAVTRAKRCLVLTPMLVKLLQCCGEKFQYPIHSAKLKKDSAVFKCAEMGKVFEPLAATLVRRPLLMASSIQLQSEVFSPQYIRQELMSWCHILGSKPDEK